MGGAIVRYSLRFNNDLPARDYVPLARAAEAAGFDQLWASNDLFLRSAAALLPTIAAATSRIQIGSCIFNPYTLHPAELAMFAATMDELSGNRFNLGLAAGAGEFLKWVGIEQTRPLVTMRETVAAIRALQRGEHTDPAVASARWTSEAYLRFKAPRVTPIYLGAMSPGMLQLAGEICDGALPLLFPPEHFATVKPMIDAGLARRSPDSGAAAAAFDFAACIWVSLDADVTTARRSLAHKIAYYGHALSPLIYERLGVSQADFRPIEQALMVDHDSERAADLVTDSMLRIGVVGDADMLLDRLRPLVAAGATHLSFGPPLGPDPLRAVGYLSERVLGRL
jgi:5,10-methylenetetrahydromethanopterin reductase